MPKSISCSLLLRQLERLTLRISEITTRDFSVLKEEHLNWKFEHSQWSIAQCIEHSNKFLEYYLQPIEKIILLQKKRNTPPTPSYKRGKYGKYGIKMVRITKQNKIKINLDSRKGYQPTPSPISKTKFDLELGKFHNQQQALLNIIQQSHTLPLGKTKIPFNFWGFYKIKLGDLLQILVYHTERHLVQAQRILYHDNFPSQVERF
jgi:hypothetical protein